MVVEAMRSPAREIDTSNYCTTSRYPVGKSTEFCFRWQKKNLQGGKGKGIRGGKGKKKKKKKTEGEKKKEEMERLPTVWKKKRI